MNGLQNIGPFSPLQRSTQCEWVQPWTYFHVDHFCPSVSSLSQRLSSFERERENKRERERGGERKVKAILVSL